MANRQVWYQRCCRAGRLIFQLTFRLLRFHSMPPE